MSFYSCSVPFAYYQYPRCDGSVAIETDPNVAGNYYTCSVPFVVTSGYIRCSGSYSNVTDISTSDDTLNLFNIDSYNNLSGYFNSPVNLQSHTIASVLTTPPANNGSEALSPADYSSLISMASFSMAIAFTFNLIYRQILNRN